MSVASLISAATCGIAVTDKFDESWTIVFECFTTGHDVLVSQLRML